MRRLEIVIVGGGLAAQRCAETLRRSGHDGALRIVCGEPHVPYDRPPLSKELLAAERAGDTLRFRPDAWYAEREVDLLLGEPAVGLDAAARRVRLADGTTVPYDRLVIATGAAARRLPAFDGLPNALVLRDLDDAIALSDRLRAGSRLAIVGGGFIGLEVAATARRLGVEVTIVETLPAPLCRVLGEEVGRWFADLHRAERVEVITGARIAGVRAGRAGTVEALDLEDGRAIEADTVLVAIGAVADTAWLAGCGLPPDGLPVDARGATALPGVFAAGDVARPLDPRTGLPARREHWEAAARGGAAVARAALGLPSPPEPPAGFWSDQYGTRIQLVGEPAGATSVVLDGDPERRDFSLTYFDDARVAAVLLVGRPAELPAARRAVAPAGDEATSERNAA